MYPGSIAENKLFVLSGKYAKLKPPSCLWLWGNNGYFLPDHRVNERGFAHIGSTNHDDVTAPESDRFSIQETLSLIRHTVERDASITHHLPFLSSVNLKRHNAHHSSMPFIHPLIHLITSSPSITHLPTACRGNFRSGKGYTSSTTMSSPRKPCPAQLVGDFCICIQYFDAQSRSII